MDAALRKEEKIYTTKDIYELPDDVHAELIDGRIYYMAPPGRMHQKISMHLSNEISAYIRKNNTSCEVYAAPFAVFLNEDDNKNYLEPDISVICDVSKLDEKGCHGAPDWIIEIVSPASRSMDYYTKLTEYKNGGVREYWIVNPMNESILVYGLEAEEAPIIYRFGDRIRSGIYSGLEIDFGRMKETL